MIQRSVLKFLSRPSQPLHLAQQGIGRWTIHYEPSIVAKKVNWANEDHCGVCETVIMPRPDAAAAAAAATAAAAAAAETEITMMMGCCCEIPSVTM
jgi:hypothetical protein